MGLKISRYSPITKVNELANAWMKKNGVAKQEGIYQVSKYQPLLYALEDGDMDKAVKEYKKLLSNSTADKISKGFSESIHQTFTGSTKNDEAFQQQLDEEGKQIYQRALDVKKSIIDKFDSIPNVPPVSDEPASTKSSSSFSIKRPRRTKAGL